MKQQLGTLIVHTDTPQFVSWLAGAQKIITDYWAARGYTHSPAPKLTANFGTRYVRIMRADTGSSSAHAFIDRTNGDVLKPATYKAPAKHARGNIFDSQNGLGSMGEYGPAYLR